MRSRDVVGRKIIGVTQNRYYDSGMDRWVTDVGGLLLDNGTAIIFHPGEGEYDHYTECELVDVKKQLAATGGGEKDEQVPPVRARRKRKAS